MIASIPSHAQRNNHHLQALFLILLPRIEQRASIVFRYVRCPQTRADKINETIALAWQWLVRLSERGRDVNEFATSFIFLVARAVKSGRRVVGVEKAKDAMSPAAQQRHNFKVVSLPTSTCTSHENLYTKPHGQQEQDAFEELMRDDSLTPVADQAAFRIDWPSWLNTRTHRDRQIIDDLMLGERTSDVSDKFGISPARVSQLRREFQEDWTHFCDEEPAADDAAECVAA